MYCFLYHIIPIFNTSYHQVIKQHKEELKYRYQTVSNNTCNPIINYLNQMYIIYRHNITDHN